MEFASGIDLLVNTLLRFEVDGRKGWLSRRHMGKLAIIHHKGGLPSPTEFPCKHTIVRDAIHINSNTSSYSRWFLYLSVLVEDRR